MPNSSNQIMSAWEEEEHFRNAGPQAMHGDDEDAKAKAEDRERKKAEVRKRLEEQGKKKAKKGFLTPERKKKLRKLLMMKAAEDLKQQQLLKEQERTKALESRILPLPDIDSIDDKGKLEQIYNEMFERVRKLEEEKYDINVQVRDKDSEINELTIAVNDLRGKFVKPQLKKVSKYDNKFKSKVQAEGGPAKADFRSNLKVVKKENAIDDLLKVEKKDKPDWKKKSDEGPKEEAPKEDPPAEDPVEEDPPADEPAAEEEGEEEEGEDEEEGEEEE